MGLNGREVFVLKGYDEVAVFLGLDVGKEGHYAVAQDRTGKKLLDRALPNDEAKLRELYGRMKAHGPVLLVVDQPATIGALPVAVALDEGVTVAYLPGLAMRRIADLHPGSAKTDARDAAVISTAARTMPHTLRALQLDDETIAELTVLSGFDDDLAGQITATSNRIRGLLTQIHPALERVLGPRLDHPAVLDLLETWPTPATLAAAGRRPRGGPPSSPGPDVTPGGRRQDRSTDTHRDGGQRLRIRRAPGLLRRPRPSDLEIRDIRPRRPPIAERKQD